MTRSKQKRHKQVLYALRNKINGDTYFGITCDFNERMKAHKHRMFLFENRKLYNSIRKYGWKNFEKEIVEVVYCRTEVLELEKFYIAEFDTFKNGLNSTPGGDGVSCRGEHPRAIRIRSYNLKTGEERMFECMLDAADELDIPYRGIGGVVSGQYKRTGNFMFQKYEPENPNKPFDPSMVLTKAEKYKKIGAIIREQRKLAVIGTHFTGFTVVFEALMDASRELGISTGKISACAQGKTGYANAYTWKYKDKAMSEKYSYFVRKLCGAKSLGKVYRVLLDGSKDVYRSGNHAGKLLDIVTDIPSAIRKGQKAGGYVWRYLDEEQQSKYPDWKPTERTYLSKGSVYRILSDGTKDKYISAGEAERVLNIKHVRRAIETGGKCGGYQWYAI